MKDKNSQFNQLKMAIIEAKNESYFLEEKQITKISHHKSCTNITVKDDYFLFTIAFYSHKKY